MRRFRRTPALPCLALLPLLVAPLAHASADDHWTFKLGAGAGATPRYSGSKDYQATPMLSFEAAAPGGFFVGTGGLGWRLALGEHASVHAYVGASGSRREKDSLLGGSDYLRGMGDIHSRALVGIAGGYTIGEAVLGASLQYTPKDQDRGDNGLATQQGRLSLELPLLHLAGGVLSGSVAADYGNQAYVQTWYGVSAAQSERSGFARHTPKAGLVSAGVGLKWSHAVGRHGDLFVSVKDTRLLGDAADSPIVQKVDQLSLMSGYNQRF